MHTVSDPIIAAKLNALHELAAAQKFPERRSMSNTQRFMAVSPEQGQFLNFLVGLTKARHIVEFGCSFGISTIYLAAAAKDSGGRVITTELEASKASTAAQNFADAGLSDVIELRVGNALETLAGTGAVDLLFLDGAKEMYLPVFRLLQPQMTAGAVVIADNVDKPETHDLVEYLRSSGEYNTACLFDGRMLAAYRLTRS
jgi:predicted O-methyltransferase YrrM